MFGRVPRVPKQASDVITTVKDIARKNRVTKSEYMDRLAACHGCDFLLKAVDVCWKCGCFVKVKAASPSMSCPIGKWSPSETAVDATEDNRGKHDADEVSAD